jgi:type III restriction enzyme
MATGSGKTFVMAGLILYLYQQGFRNFLFFVNSTNIIDKTKANFLDPNSSKYLFNDKVSFDGKIVNIKEVSNFTTSKTDDIQIKFTTIQ